MLGFRTLDASELIEVLLYGMQNAVGLKRGTLKPHDQRMIGTRDALQLRRQPRFSDTRFAGYDDNIAMAGACATPTLLEMSKLVGTANQRRSDASSLLNASSPSKHTISLHLRWRTAQGV